MVPTMVRDAVNVLVQTGQVPEEYRQDLEVAVDREMRRKARLFGTALGRMAMTNVMARGMLAGSAS